MLDIECMYIYIKEVFTQFGRGSKYVLYEQKNINEQINASFLQAWQ